MKTKLTFLIPILVLVLTFESYSQCDHLKVNEYTGSYKKVSDKELEFAQVHEDSLQVLLKSSFNGEKITVVIGEQKLSLENLTNPVTRTKGAMSFKKPKSTSNIVVVFRKQNARVKYDSKFSLVYILMEDNCELTVIQTNKLLFE